MYCIYKNKQQKIFFVVVLALSAVTIIAQKPIFRVTVIGAGYVGLVSSVIFAEYGNNVTCVDIDERSASVAIRKINMLQEGQMPILEHGVQELLQKNLAADRLHFTSDMATAIAESDIIFIAVGTPMQEDGHADLRALFAVADSIAEYVTEDKIICIKSTVPIGTAQRLRDYLTERMDPKIALSIVSNPEFLREGSALADFINRNPIVVGAREESTIATMKQFYQPFLERGLPIIVTDNTTAETIKYSWNAFSAVKIAYANQIAMLCNAVGANIFSVISGIGYSDDLLPMREIIPGPGYGGSCLPKDTNALAKIADAVGVDLSIVKAVIAANEQQKEQVVSMLYQLLGGVVKNKHIAILGLSFKQDTDDIRFSPAINALERLLQDGAQVHAYDPASMQHMATLFPKVTYHQTAYDTLKDADAIMLLTPWDEFKGMDLTRVAGMVKQKIVVDARNIWNPQMLHDLGFTFVNLGYRVIH